MLPQFKVSAQRCPESDGRLHKCRAVSERNTEGGYVLGFPFPRISTLPYSTGVYDSAFRQFIT